MESESLRETNSICKTTIRCLVFLTLIAVFIVAIIERDWIYDRIGDFTSWLKENPVAGPFVLAGILALGEIFFIPSSLLTVLAGFAFEKAYTHHKYAIIVGTVSGWIGISLGALITMGLGRFVFQA